LVAVELRVAGQQQMASIQDLRAWQIQLVEGLADQVLILEMVEMVDVAAAA
jgi:hypothetical protein